MREFTCIVHLTVASPFMDNATYQDTMLAEAHKRKYNNVSTVTTNLELDAKGEIHLCTPREYYSSGGVRIIRLNTHRKVNRSRGNVGEVYRTLCRLTPDFIMDHVFCPTSCIAVHLYKRKHPECKVVADSHMTETNYIAANSGIRERVLVRLLRLIGLLYYKDCDKIYGITDQTLRMLSEIYKVPASKTELLPLGYDATDVFPAKDINRDNYLPKQVNVMAESKVLITGGKLSPEKKTLELVQALKSRSDIFLLVFGGFLDKEYESEVKEAAGKNTAFLGSLMPKQIHDLLRGSDIAVFPGSPSCLRQDAVATGVPILYAKYPGDESINLIQNNNGIVINRNWTTDELNSSIDSILSEYDIYREKALELANEEYKIYSYDRQADYVLIN